jgi:TRAP-type mannitol/chloroaromatic compound transport system permease large subunit
MFMGMPIAVCMASVGFGGLAVLWGTQKALIMLGMVPYSTIASYFLSVLPVYLLMGEFADVSGLMRDSYRAANTWLGNLRGGLAMASILGAAFFSTVSGSSMACAAIMARISLPSLLDEYKYDPRLATGALCAGGTLGNLVPPGIAFVFYALMSETSIGKLYVAALIPGIILTLMYLIQRGCSIMIMPYLMNPDSWKKLTPDLQKVLVDACKWQEEEILKPDEADIQAALKFAQDNNHKITNLTAEEIQQWVDAAKPVHEKWIAENSARGPAQAIYDETKRLIRETTKR